MKNNAIKKTLFSIGLGIGISLSASVTAGSICPLWEAACSAGSNSACLSWAINCAPDRE